MQYLYSIYLFCVWGGGGGMYETDPRVLYENKMTHQSITDTTHMIPLFHEQPQKS